jgi:hypothetical protein
VGLGVTQNLPLTASADLNGPRPTRPWRAWRFRSGTKVADDEAIAVLEGQLALEKIEAGKRPAPSECRSRQRRRMRAPLVIEAENGSVRSGVPASPASAAAPAPYRGGREKDSLPKCLQRQRRPMGRSS